MIDFKINNFITLKFRYPNTEIYINGKYFIQCKRLLLSIHRIEQAKDIESIDEAAEVYNHSIYDSQVIKDEGMPEVENDENFSSIRPEEEFWGHCSNLQVWCEHNYDTRLLKANLAFPLLEKLAKEGDNLARIKFKEEILKRILSGSESVIEYLFVEGYQDFLSNEDLLFGLLNFEEAESLLNLQKELGIIFKFVPSINRGLDLAWKDRKIIHKFSTNSKRVTGLDLTNCNLYEIPYEVFKLKKLQILNIEGNSSFRTDLGHFEEILKKLIHLKMIVFSINQIKTLPIETERLLKNKETKTINRFHRDFITLE